ncbi:major facilitator superfamily domain-containing protein [Cokeromyces recurvatus]|uniref:major facilitator superfamily domain-containing protein n=1 Tax=Cokeromyces recurvatus TaxID=90255 RepID=UPI00222051D4|nr:major facilitator superfamily domain-containing protein [Cokeromyces recurvatus]KAI7904427.1 major facilitator superfamily domain-containing protein [Cokeromyces recurvatus]
MLSNEGSDLHTQSDNNDIDKVKPSSITIVPEDIEIEKYLDDLSSQNEESDMDPYSILSRKQKIMIVTTISVLGFISPFSTNIYFPALSIIQNDLHVSERMVSLTVTMYMVMQGLSPSFWGSLADSWGRRPIFIITFLIYILACIGMANTKNYASLLSLRMIQAFGSSSAVAVGAGVIGDISTPAERGGYMGVFSMGTMLGPLLGPVLGGLVSNELGWRWIFWILTILVIPIWLIQIFFLPETLRSLVGNGSGYANPTPIQFFKKRRRRRDFSDKSHILSSTHSNFNKSHESLYSSSFNATVACSSDDTNRTCMNTLDTTRSHYNNHTLQTIAIKKRNRFLVIPNPFQSLGFLREKDVAVLLLYNSLQYAGLYCVVTSLTDLFTNIYGLNAFYIGLCFLSNGFGAAMGSFTSGKILNWRFKKIATSLNIDRAHIKRGNIDSEFPVENARMGITWIWGIAFNIALILYGWCLYLKVHIAIPIIINSLLSYFSTSTFNATNTLLVDLFPKNSAAIVASNNLTRLSLDAYWVQLL